MKRIQLISFLILLTATTHVFAQTTTGNIEGRVNGPDGEPLAGVLVKISGPQLQGTFSLVNQDNGYFLIPELPTGTFTLVASHEQYGDATVPTVMVRLGVTTNIGTIYLAVQPYEMDDVIVTAQAPLVDPASTTVGGNLAYEEFSELPIDRDYKNMTLLLPHSNPSYLGDGTNISGATSLGNKYFIDGVDVTDPNQGNGGTELPYNFIREVRVRTGGYEAEYRSSLGGILEVVTNTGSNELHGQVFGFFTNSGLTGSPETSAFIAEQGDFTFYDYGFGMGGPIVKDKLWFYAALNPTTRIEDISIPGPGDYESKDVTYRFAGKLNWRANENNDFVLSVFGDPGGGEAIWFWPMGLTMTEAENADPFLWDKTSGGINSILEGTHWLSDRFMLRSSLSMVSNTRRMLPRTERGKNEQTFIDAETGIWSGGNPGQIDKTGSVFTGGLHGIWLKEKHTWKVGLEYRVITGKVDEHVDVLIRYADDDWVNRNNEARGEARTVVPSLYLQDSWRLTDQLRLNPGLRWDGQIISTDGETVIEILDQWQPRLGFTYQVGSSGTQQIFGSAGRFYQEISLNLPINQYSTGNLWGSVSYDHDPRVDPTGGDVSEWTSSIPEESDYQGQHHDEFTLGYERQLAESSRIRVRGIYRTLRRGIEDSYAEEDDEWYIGNVGYGNLTSWDPMKRDYLALELTYLINKPKYTSRISYVLSRTKGNYPGLFGSDTNMMFPNLTTAFDDPETMPNSDGLLPNDRTHVFKFSGSYKWDFGLTAGTFITWMSGTPLNEHGLTPWGYYSFLEERGSAGRTPSIWSINLRLSYLFRQSSQSGLQPRLIADLMDIGSPRTVVNADQLKEFDVDNPNPSYGVATGYQPPMSVRLGLEVGF